MYNLAHVYRKGLGVKKDPDAAEKWTSKAKKAESQHKSPPRKKWEGVGVSP